ncbi:MAG: HAD family phosphatase [Candidatus Vogelbacteria bacterium]|nr:HAD family phosphatase [Candidatus Vogelbacteria bacterium]
MNKIRAVIFDMDGVIINSEQIHVMAENFVLNKYGIFPTEKEWDSFKGKTSAGIFSQIIIEHHIEGISVEYLTGEKVDKFLEMMLAADIELFDGLVDLINDLSVRFSLALSTSSHSRIQKVIFDRFDLHKYFSVVVTGDMIKIGKPDPEPYLLAIDKLGVPADSCVVIEDSVNGVASAKSAGAKVVAVTHSFSANMLHQADVIVDSLSAIREIF